MFSRSAEHSIVLGIVELCSANVQCICIPTLCCSFRACALELFHRPKKQKSENFAYFASTLFSAVFDKRSNIRSFFSKYSYPSFVERCSVLFREGCKNAQSILTEHGISLRTVEIACQ